MIFFSPMVKSFRPSMSRAFENSYWSRRPFPSVSKCLKASITGTLARWMTTAILAKIWFSNLKTWSLASSLLTMMSYSSSSWSFYSWISTVLSTFSSSSFLFLSASLTFSAHIFTFLIYSFCLISDVSSFLCKISISWIGTAILSF